MKCEWSDDFTNWIQCKFTLIIYELLKLSPNRKRSIRNHRANACRQPCGRSFVRSLDHSLFSNYFVHSNEWNDTFRYPPSIDHFYLHRRNIACAVAICLFIFVARFKSDAHVLLACFSCNLFLLATTWGGSTNEWLYEANCDRTSQPIYSISCQVFLFLEVIEHSFLLKTVIFVHFDSVI